MHQTLPVLNAKFLLLLLQGCNRMRHEGAKDTIMVFNFNI